MGHKSALIPLVVLVVAAVAVAIALFLWSEGERGREPGRTGGGTDPSASEAPHLVPELPGTPPVEGESGSEDPPPPTEGSDRMVAGTAVLEDGTPLPGVTVTSGPFTATSGLDGVFEIREGDGWFAVTHPDTLLVRVEGGAIFRSSKIVRPETEATVRAHSSRLKLVFEDREDIAYLRLVDAAMGRPITDITGLCLQFSYGGDGDLPVVRGSMVFEGAPDLGGWIALPAGETPITVVPFPEPGQPVMMEIDLVGYAIHEFPMTELVGRTEMHLTPEPPAARGSVYLGPGLAGASVRASFRRLDPDGPPLASDLSRVPVRGGRLLLRDLPDGRYEVEVIAIKNNNAVRAKAEFERHGGTAEIGEIRVMQWAGIRARVLDPDGRLVRQGAIVVVREEEEPERGRRLEPDSDGFVTFHDFEPGAYHRVVALGLPDPLERIVRAPRERGGTETVELMTRDHLVPCRLRFSVEGRVIDGRREIIEAPIATWQLTWEGDLLTAELLPGTYVFRAAIVGEEEPEIWTARVEVLRGATLEGTVEMALPR